MKKLLYIIPIVLLLAGCGDKTNSTDESTKTKDNTKNTETRQDNTKEEKNTDNNKTGSITCTLSTNDVVTGYSLKSEYKINYKGDYATSVESTEVVKSESKDVLDYFETTLNTTYKTMNSTYGGYTYKITNKNGSVTSTVTIDYNKMNIKQLVKDQPSLKTYVKDDKLTVDGIKSMYEPLGVVCK